jgi:hypothetical protein
LGTNFCKKANTVINFTNEGCNVTSNLRNKQNKFQAMNLMVKIENCKFTKTDESNYQADSFLCANYMGTLHLPDKTENLGNVQFDVSQTIIWIKNGRN